MGNPYHPFPPQPRRGGSGTALPGSLVIPAPEPVEDAPRRKSIPSRRGDRLVALPPLTGPGGPKAAYAISPSRQSLIISCAALCPGAPDTDPPGNAPDPHRYRFFIGVL